MNPVRTPLRWVVSLSLSAIVAALSIASAQTPPPGRLLVLLRDASALAIVDPASGTVLGRVPTGNTLFMPNTGSNSVTMVENIMAVPSESKLTVIPVPGELPESIDLSPDGREIWTATRNDGGVSIVDVASRRVVQTLNPGMQDANRLKFTQTARC